MEFEGYHGTDSVSGNEICRNGFKDSTTIGWFGPGIYFFENMPQIEFDAKLEAKGWAIRIKQFRNWCVIKSKIVSDKVVDLLERNQRVIFGKIREGLLTKHKNAGLSLEEFEEYTVYVCMANENDAEVIRSLVNADSSIRNSWLYTIGRPQVQICVINANTIQSSVVDWSGMEL